MQLSECRKRRECRDPASFRVLRRDVLDRHREAGGICLDLDRMTVACSSGSAQISTIVRSGPMPANDKAAATLTFAGKPTAASRALPLKIKSGRSRPSSVIPLASRNGAPTSTCGGFLVVSRTERIVPSAAAATASSPIRAPVGTRICPPVARASSISSTLRSSAPALSTITRLPAASIGRQMSSRIRGRRSLHRQIRVLRKTRQRQDGAVDALVPEPCCSLGLVAGSDPRKRHSGHAVRETARQGPPDCAEPGNCDPRDRHPI